MATYLLDTSVIVDVLNRKRNRQVVLERLLLEGNLLACCAINVAEVYAGMRPDEAARTDALLQSLHYCDITWEMARLAGRLRYEQARKGRTLSVADTLVAAVALADRMVLITDNVRDYPIAGLELFPLPTG
jgi:predicted nucleic acid-binding protein